jgi:hypothetical protein
MPVILGYSPGIFFAAIRNALGDKVSIFAAAETPALLVKRPFAVFMIDCSLDLEAVRGASKIRRGEPLGVVEGYCGLETDMIFAGASPGAIAAFPGDARVAVDADFVCPKPGSIFPGLGDNLTGVLIRSS